MVVCWYLNQESHANKKVREYTRSVFIGWFKPSASKSNVMCNALKRKLGSTKAIVFSLLQASHRVKIRRFTQLYQQQKVFWNDRHVEQDNQSPTQSVFGMYVVLVCRTCTQVVLQFKYVSFFFWLQTA